MPERDGQNSFTAKPTIRNYSDEVEWRKRIKNGNKHLYNVIFFAVFSEILHYILILVIKLGNAYCLRRKYS
jgi:hypothetical protein